MASVFDRPLKGVYIPHRKHTMESAVETMPVPNRVYIVMSQHMGPPCEVQVAVGDEVKVGQVLGESDALLTSPIHSSVSGTVAGIEQIIMPNGTRSKTVVVEADKKQELHESVRVPDISTRQSFLDAVRRSGMVGLGGAGFPTHVKFKARQAIDTLIINAAECEPYITSDYRTVMEHAEDVLEGVRAIMRGLDIKCCRIGVEDNKPKAIQKLREMTGSDDRIEVVRLRSKYPQGAEKVLIYEIAARVVPEGKLPADIGAIVTNVTTAASLAQYFRDGVPLIAKTVTVDGGAVHTPKNVRVRIGTPIRDLVAFCGGYKSEPRKILMGGPMMGTAIYDDGYPILKNNNAILAMDESETLHYRETACIRCGRCMRACPMNLMPMRIEDCFNRGDNEGLAAFKVNLCMECGCCSYSCPAKRHLVHVNRLAKARLRAAQAPK